MNVASANWTRMPENFDVARQQWEYSHAVNAVLTFAALVAITPSAVGGRMRTRCSHPPGSAACHLLSVVAMNSLSSCALRSNARKS